MPIEEQLLRNLTEIESQLRRVKSANEQVERIIESDKLLVNGIREYISKADTLLGAVKAAYDEAASKVNEQASLAVKETTDGLLGEYKSEVKTARAEYNASMRESVDSFKGVVDSEKRTLQTKVAALTQLMDEKLIPLRDSLSSIVDGKIARIPEDFKGIVIESKSTLDSSAAALKSASDVVSDECRKMAEKVVALPDKFDGLGADLTKALSDNKERILAKLAEIDVDVFAGKVTEALGEQTSHFDDKLDLMGKSLDDAISVAKSSLAGKVDKMDSRIDGLTNHIDGGLGKLEKSFEGSLSKVDRSLTSGVKKTETVIGEVDKKLAAMQERLDGMNRTLTLFKVLAVVFVIAAVILVVKFI